MNLLLISQIIAVAGILIGLAGILLRLREILNRPFKQDLSRARGDVRRGILYAFTLGMAPWEKESTRRHWVAYIRGILFHVGVFAAIGILLASPWLFPQGQASNLPSWLLAGLALVTGAGALFGFAGIAMRLSGENERALSLPDDYFSVFLTSLFTALASLVLFVPAGLPAFLIVGGLLAAYIPMSKIRHCVYFFYSKFFFGKSFGQRGVIGHSESPFSK